MIRSHRSIRSIVRSAAFSAVLLTSVLTGCVAQQSTPAPGLAVLPSHRSTDLIASVESHTGTTTVGTFRITRPAVGIEMSCVGTGIAQLSTTPAEIGIGAVCSKAGGSVTAGAVYSVIGLPAELTVTVTASASSRWNLSIFYN